MATWDDVRSIALALPEAAEPGPGQWRVRNKLFAWERGLRDKDLAELGDAAPEETPLAVRVPGVGAQEALVKSEPDVYFITSHFAGYPAVLVRLDRVDVAALKELLTEAWLVQAPKRLGKEYLAKEYP